jgi:hypothetical protein
MKSNRTLAALPAAVASLVLASGCLPQLGAVDGNTFGDSVRLSDPRFGSSKSPNVVVRIEIDEHGKEPPAGVGRIVKQTFFAGAPPFTFNVSFACGAPGPGGQGTYTDPKSIWFNVFMGYYEIDVPKATWGRPFGYRFDGAEVRVVLGDLVRIGKSDWNYFSNYVYGVPREAVHPYENLDHGSGDYLGRVPVGDRSWDLIELRDVEVVSAYLSEKDGQRLVDHDPISTPIWRSSFGRPHPEADFPVSFLPTKMRAKLYMSFTEGYDSKTHEIMYRTTLFGGTTNDIYPDRKENEAFLEAQLEAVRRVMLKSYPDLGFR